MLFTKSPYILKHLFPSLVWHKERTKKTLYITFDDGPIPELTPWVLNELKKANAKATFFCIGDNVKKHPDVFKMIIDDGHSIGNHTFNHLSGWTTDTDTYLDNIKKCEDFFQTRLFRPPYGRITKPQISILKSQYSIVMWDVLSRDYNRRLSPFQCLHNAIDHAKEGSIVVFHDSLKAEKNLRYALPIALSYWAERGFELKGL